VQEGQCGCHNGDGAKCHGVTTHRGHVRHGTTGAGGCGIGHGATRLVEAHD
jgi:hypothetical protein